MAVDLIKWIPWPPLNSKKYEASIRVRCLKGGRAIGGYRDDHSHSPSSSGGRCPRLTVEIRWNGSKSNGFIALSKKVKRNFTREEAVDQNGVVEWNEEFKSVCSFSGSSNWEVAFIVLKASDQGQMNKFVVAGPTVLDLAEFASVESEQVLDISVPLTQSSSIDWFLTLSLTLHLKELRTNQETPRTFLRSSTLSLSAPFSPCFGIPATLGDDPIQERSLRKAKSLKEYVSFSRRKSKKAYRVEAISEGKLSTGRESPEGNCSFDIYSLEYNNKALLEDNNKEVYDNVDRISFGYGTLITANAAGRMFDLKTSCKDEDLVHFSNADSLYTPELTLKHSPKLRKPKTKMSIKSEKVKGEPLLKKEYGEIGGDDLDLIRRQLCTSDDLSIRGYKTESEFGDDSFRVGSWEYIEVVSRDRSLKLQTQVFFATIDQMSKKAAGESACTALVVVLAHWLHSNRNQMPNKSELDSLIREGSHQWRSLCEDESYMARFPDKHFDLETVIQAKIRPISVASTTGFFHPEEMENEGLLEYLDGSRSFDCVWDEISTSGCDPLIYIVSWNDHFFVLKVEDDAFYVVDTLGERLQEGCRRAYVLKFDKDTRIRGEDDIVVCVGKEACKEYIKKFLAAIPIRELQDDIKGGRRLHELLQIDIHYTELLLTPTDTSCTELREKQQQWELPLWPEKVAFSWYKS